MNVWYLGTCPTCDICKVLPYTAIIEVVLTVFSMDSRKD